MDRCLDNVRDRVIAVRIVHAQMHFFHALGVQRDGPVDHIAVQVDERIWLVDVIVVHLENRLRGIPAVHMADHEGDAVDRPAKIEGRVHLIVFGPGDAVGVGLIHHRERLFRIAGIKSSMIQLVRHQMMLLQ